MIRSVEIGGFKSFANEAQKIELSPTLTVIHGENSQGKTSLAEAFEFLFSGTISRRMLSGGSPAEFQGALKNVHLAQEKEAQVTALTGGDSDTPKKLRRLLVSDFEGASQCVTQLTLDDLEIEAATDGGFQLSPTPLPTAVLMEHALRYAVSAKPGERSEFFRAVLDMGDVDEFVTAVDELIAARSEAYSEPPGIVSLRELSLVSGMDELESIANCVTEAEVRAVLQSVFMEKFPAENVESSGAQPEEWDAVLLRVEREVEALRTGVIPLESLVAPKKRASLDSPSVYTHEERPSSVLQVDVSKRQIDGSSSVVEAYESWRTTFADSARHRKLLETVDRAYESDRKDPQHEPEDCPLCGASGTFTRERLVSIHEQLLTQSDGFHAIRSVEKFVRELERISSSAESSAKEAVPAVCGWDDERRAEFEKSVKEVGADTSLLRNLFEAHDKAREMLCAVGDAAKLAAESCATISHQIDSNAELRVEHIWDLEKAWIAVGSAVRSANAALDTAGECSSLVVNNVQPLADSRAEIKEWVELLGISRDVVALVSDLAESRAHLSVDRRLQAARRKIRSGVSTVLNSKVEGMANEVRRWWRLLRPHDQDAFSDLAPRGKGVRYLDLVASFADQEDNAVAQRNPLAVFSTSQMNALGLASFIARARLTGSPFVFLDDPVSGSDREHRLSFANNIVSALLADGVQVVISTHDGELARILQTLYQQDGVLMYGVTLEDRARGTRVELLKSKFEELMADAQTQMHSPLKANRRSVGISLRIAAEQLAKRIIVDGRIASGDVDADVADYEGKNLKDLRPLVGGYAIFPDEVGKWGVIVRELNNAGHDAEPPTSGDLKVAFDTLRDIRKKHRSVSLI